MEKIIQYLIFKIKQIINFIKKFYYKYIQIRIIIYKIKFFNKIYKIKKKLKLEILYFKLKISIKIEKIKIYINNYIIYNIKIYINDILNIHYFIIYQIYESEDVSDSERILYFILFFFLLYLYSYILFFIIYTFLNFIF